MKMVVALVAKECAVVVAADGMNALSLFDTGNQVRRRARAMPVFTSATGNLGSLGRTILLAAMLLAAAQVVADPIVIYLGRTDITHTTYFARYHPDTQTMDDVKTPFPQYRWLEMSPDGVMYGKDVYDLYTIDPATGDATFVATIIDGTWRVNISGLTFRPDGLAYAHVRAGDENRLYELDVETGALTFITLIDGLSDSLHGIEYADGVLYGTWTAELYTIDTTTGDATLVGTHDTFSIWDMDYGTDGIMRGADVQSPVCYIGLTTGAVTILANYHLEWHQCSGIATAGWDPPSIHHIVPGWGANDGPLDITDLSGTAFQQGTVVTLEKAGEADIVGTDVDVVSTRKITCTFDLTGVAPGSWDVTVTTPDGRGAFFQGGVHVNAPNSTVIQIGEGTSAVYWPMGTGVERERPRPSICRPRLAAPERSRAWPCVS